MSGCGVACILYIWTLFLWPFIVPSGYIVFKGKQIISKGKFFLLSLLIGYALIIGVIVLMNYLKDNTEMNELLLNSTEIQQTLFWWFGTCIMFLPTIVASHVLSKKYS